MLLPSHSLEGEVAQITTPLPSYSRVVGRDALKHSSAGWRLAKNTPEQLFVCKKMPTASLQTLERPDGSATYSNNGYTIIGAVNGPVEVQRRDEIPDESAIDVVVRPASGVGGNSTQSLYHSIKL